MKVYAVMCTSNVQNGQYSDLFVTLDNNDNLCIGPEVFLTREEAEEWINLTPAHIREDFTIVELGFKSIKEYKD